jgi:uncharacterized protein involved in response to NO
MTASQGKTSRYPAILSYGFRPFFLLGAAYGALIILIWLPIFHGSLQTHSSFAAVDWHVHETLFGYVAAVIAGFLLTAIPNWTGRLPVQGIPLFMLVLLWLAGRVAVFFSGQMHWIGALAIDGAFLAALVTAAAVEIVAGRNWRNLVVLVPVSLLLASNVLFHVEVRFNGTSDISRRLAIGIIAVLITIIGGRVIPSFTRNWLARENPWRRSLSLPGALRRTIASPVSCSSSRRACICYGWYAGRVIAPCAIRSSWSCMPAISSYRSACCWPALALCLAIMSRKWGPSMFWVSAPSGR